MSEKNPYLKLVMSVLFKNYVDQEKVLAGGKAWIGNSVEFMKIARKTGITRRCALLHTNPLFYFSNLYFQ